MINYFKKENRELFADKNQRECSILTDCIFIVLYLISAFGLFEALYLICNLIGSIVEGSSYQSAHEFIRVVPKIVAYFSLVYLTAYLQSVVNAKDKKNRKNLIKGNGFPFAIIGLFIVIYIIVGLINGEYHNIFEGYPKFVFPFLIMLLGLFYTALGVCSVVFSGRVSEKFDGVMPYKTDKVNTVLKCFDHIFYTIYYFVATICFAGFIYSFFIADFKHGNLFYIVMLEILFLMPSIMTFFWKFICGKLKDEYKRGCQLVLSCIFLFIGVIFSVLYVISLSCDTNAAGISSYGLLPIDFTASVTVSTYILVASAIIPPLSALVKSLFKKKS